MAIHSTHQSDRAGMPSATGALVSGITNSLAALFFLVMSIGYGVIPGIIVMGLYAAISIGVSINVGRIIYYSRH